MKILVIGGGGREHALAWKLRQSPRASAVYCAPGNAGTAALARNVPLTDPAALARFAAEEGIGFTVVGPDNALAAGIVDLFESKGLRIFGPLKSAARFEWSKVFAKDFMKRHGIPTAAFGHFTSSGEARRFCQGMSYPLVLKADGLALGKGVVIAGDEAQAAATIGEMMDDGRFGDAGRGIVIEEFLEGRECSLHALLDGKNFLLLPGAQDYKQVFDGNTGPNTGGMGGFSPSPLLTTEMEKQVRREILEPFMEGLRAEGITYRGVLYPGLMLTAAGPKVLEFNSRFGDPETQVLLPRLKSDLVELLEAAVDGRLDECEPEWSEQAAVCVVMASEGYPGPSETGREIFGLDAVDPGVLVFHAGTALREGKVATSGGRVLGVTALGADVESAQKRAYEAVSRIRFDGAHYRTDIAADAARWNLAASVS